jgi:hypothetical protein
LFEAVFLCLLALTNKIMAVSKSAIIASSKAQNNPLNHYISVIYEKYFSNSVQPDILKSHFY